MRGFVSQSSLRRAKIIGRAVDAWGDPWDVREARKTNFGFDVLLGWPAGTPRGRGGSGGIRVIVTPDLASWLNALRGTRAPVVLPIGATAIKRIRRLLGYDGVLDRSDWWEMRSEDLADMTLAAFCKKHSVSMGAASQARTVMYGPALRPVGWWRADDIAALLTSEQPVAVIADQLQISASGARRLRATLRHEIIARPDGHLPPGHAP